MGLDSPMSRRKFLGASAGIAGAAALGRWTTGAFSDTNPGNGHWVVPPGQLSTQQFSARDAYTRLDQAVLGRLDDDPTAPNVPLPGGFRSVFAYLASLGYTGVEFFSFSQGANGPITNAELRQALDDNGLTATGTHTANPNTLYDPATGGFSAAGLAEVDRAHTLGMEMIGFSGNPSSLVTLADRTNANGTVTPGWQTVANRINAVGALLKAEGIKYYWHPEQPAWQFFNDPAHPELSRTHILQWIRDNTDPSLLFYEMDMLHWYSGWLERPDPVTGQLTEDPLQIALDDVGRFVGFHIKDGLRIRPLVTPPAPPYTQTLLRTVNGVTFVDTVADGEGDIGRGYPADPNPRVVGYKSFFDQIQSKGNNRYKTVLKYISETDSGPGPTTGTGADPGRSLRWQRHSAAYLLGLRVGDNGLGTGKPIADDSASGESTADG